MFWHVFPKENVKFWAKIVHTPSLFFVLFFVFFTKLKLSLMPSPWSSAPSKRRENKALIYFFLWLCIIKMEVEAGFWTNLKLLLFSDLGSQAAANSGTVQSGSPQLQAEFSCVFSQSVHFVSLSLGQIAGCSAYSSPVCAGSAHTAGDNLF